MRFLLFFNVVILSVLINNIVESRRVFGGTRAAAGILPTFNYPNSFKNKINHHKFLPKDEYTVYYEQIITSTFSPNTMDTVMPSTEDTSKATTTATTTLEKIVPAMTSTTTTTTTTTTLQPTTSTISFIHFVTDVPSTKTIPASTASSTLLPSTTTPEHVPSKRDGNFDWFGVLIVILITLAAITFFIARRKCSLPSGTYRVPKTNLVPKDYYVNFCKIDDDFIEIHARALYGPSYMTSIENQNFEDKNNEETCL